MIYYLFNLKLSGWSLVAFLLAYILAILIAIISHEFSHALTAYKFGDPTPKLTKRLSINPVNHFDVLGILSFLFVGFGWAKPVQINPLNFRNYNRGRRWVAVSGIITNLMLSIIFSALYFFFSEPLLASANIFLKFVGYFLMFMFAINLSLAVFNLIPIYPLDGFNFIETFLKPGNRFVEFMHRYGHFIMLIFIISPLFDIVYGYLVGGVQTGLFLFWGLF